ncbi:MAG: PilZ domain-containing protein [Myxococcota bacterium]
MTAKISEKRKIIFDAPAEALGPWTDVILARLGYSLLSPDAFAEARSEEPDLRADLHLLDERRIEEAERFEDEAGIGPPVILLTGQYGVKHEDPRIIGGIKRPAGLHDLYCLVQQVFEDTPRSTPRVPTQLRARCARRDQEWDSRVLSLSENGCLIRSPESIPLGQRVTIDLDLPRSGPLSLDAEAAYQLLPDTGLVFSALAPDQRNALEEYVTQSILTA